MKVEYFIAVVDRTNEWLSTVETRLRRAIKDPCQVLGFTSTDQFMGLLDRFSLRVPLLAIADTDAVKPSPAEGLFARVRPVVGRCLCVYYSADPRPEILQDLSRISNFRLITRTRKDSIERLVEVIEQQVESIEGSTDQKLITMYEGYVSQTQTSDMSTVDDEKLSPIAMLSEMARGSVDGRRYLRHMIPRSWGPRKQHGTAVER